MFKARQLSSKVTAVALTLIVGFWGPGSVAYGRGSGEPKTSPPAAGEPQPAATPAPAPSPAVLEELHQLRQNAEAQAQAFAEHSRDLEAERAGLREQLDRIAALEAKLGVEPAIQVGEASAEVLTAAASPVQTTQTQTPQDWSNRIANLENQVKKFGPFAISGDFRLRAEPFIGGPIDQSLVRTRARYRLRFNVDTKLNQDFSGGLSLASGEVNDPISTNQNVDGFYTRKPFFIDKAFIDYNPHQFTKLTLLGGKFAYPWYNTELTWDKDLNPEGVAQTLAFNLDTPRLKKIALIGFELPFAQVAKTLPNDKSIVQSITYGAQFQTNWQLAPWLKLGAFSGFYDFHNADAIALALARASSKNPQSPLSGLLPLQAGNGVTNSQVTTTATNVVTIGGVAYPTGVTSVANSQFSSKFVLFDSLVRFDVKTPSEKWPIAIIGDYVQNLEACSNINHIAPPPANTASVHYTQTTNFPCVSNQRRGYWSEAQVGRAKQGGDWQFGYAWIFVEREAVLSNFNYSEMRQGSNVTEHRASILYQLNRNVQLSFIDLIGRPLNLGSKQPPQPWLQRLQFDVLYSF